MPDNGAVLSAEELAAVIALELAEMVERGEISADALQEWCRVTGRGR